MYTLLIARIADKDVCICRFAAPWLVAILRVAVGVVAVSVVTVVMVDAVAVVLAVSSQLLLPPLELLVDVWVVSVV